MGIFSNLFGKKEGKKEEKEEQEVYYAQQNERMEKAYAQAQQTFKYYWREVYWEYRRIIPGLDLSIVKIPFEQKFNNKEEPVVEHMWINEIDFDGEKIHGVLMNSPNQLTNVSEGDRVSFKLSQISDWLFAMHGKTYGAFTIQLLRSEMGEQERKQHDEAWGLDFGDFNDIMVVHSQKENPENLIEHPMSINMGEKAREYFVENPEAVTDKDENGITMLHTEAIAGNKTTIDILLELGADRNAKTNSGKTAFDYAKNSNWVHIISVLK